MDYLKGAAISGAVAALLSLIAGLFGGVGLGFLFFRAFLFFLLGGSLAAGIRWVIKKFLPELLETSSEEAEEEEGMSAAGTAGRVNIVLPQDAPSVAGSVTVNPSSGNEEDISEVEPLVEERILSETSTSNDTEDVESIPMLSDVDELPDMGKFAGSFQSVTEEEDTENNSGVSSEFGDPAEMAKAVRTFLNKDQEG